MNFKNNDDKKVGIIRRQKNGNICPGNTDFLVAKGKLVFQKIGPPDVIGFISCCSNRGKKTASRTKLIVERGAEAIALASCITKGDPIGFYMSQCRTDKNSNY
ncbi:MAG: CGGC domain-containing protein [Bacteroidales bacterium]|nr:CGGC domain-containing protein [Bacteroidales bacterium]